MVVVGAWLGVIAGGVVFYLSMRVVSRANTGRRIPYWSKPEVTPGAAIGLRMLGIFLVAFSASFLAPSIGLWSIAVLVAALTPALLLIPTHNRRALVATGA